MTNALRLMTTVLLGLCTLAPAFAVAAKAEEYRFSIHHFLSPKAITHTKFLVPWAERVTRQSGGRLKFEIFPSMTLGGKPPELYRQVRDGTADFVWTLPGYTPGVFPRLEVFELAGVHGGSAVATTEAIQDVLPMVAADLADVKPILVHVHAGNALHLVSKDVKSLGDLRGMKLRSPSRTGVWMLQSWGAEPVGMPVPALPQALSKGTIDGALIPFEVAVPLRIAELTSNSVELMNGRRFGTSVFLFAMNKARYDALPDDLKKIIDDNSGANISKGIGELWDSMEPVGKKRATDLGKTVRALSPETSAAFDAPAKEVAERWTKEASARGIDAQALLKAARDAIAKRSTK
ncbi:MAG: TRAP transporter substrate-binding protein [Pseudomonadota bacterium]